MYTQVGTCPHCGAPIYTYTVWHGITPPPNIYTCNCVPQPQFGTSTDGTGVVIKNSKIDGYVWTTTGTLKIICDKCKKNR